MTMTAKASRKSGRSKVQIEARRREREVVRALGTDVRNQRLDSGISQSALGRHAEISQGEMSRIEAGKATATIRTLAALSIAMDGRLVVRIEPGTGIPIRDHLQARILEALLRGLDPRWKRFVEVPVYRPVRGVIDLVLHDVDANVVVAVEVHSQIRRLEQQLRWANAKADALLDGSDLPLVRPDEARPILSRLLVLRSTAATRALANEVPDTLRAAYPASSAAAVAALTAGSAWPGSAIVWASVEGRAARILRRQPRTMVVGQ